MRLDPVYVVAPRPASQSMSTRRAFLFASGTFAFGATLGGACGYAVGASAAPPVEPAAEPPTTQPSTEPALDEPLKPSGDVELDELRRLAVKAPIDELIKNRVAFLTLLGRRYPSDEVLWRGVQRLADEVLKRSDYPSRRIAAMSIAQVVENGHPRLKQLVGDKLQGLRAIK